MIVFWAFFYIVVTPILAYYLFVKNNRIDNCISKVRDRFAKFISSGIITSFLNFIFQVTESVIVVLFIQRFFLGHFRVPTLSMYPTIAAGDHFLVDMVSSNFIDPKRGEIYVFKSPVKSDLHVDRWCKRVVALPGDRVRISEDNKLYIDDKVCSDCSYVIKRDSYMSNSEWLVPRKGDTLSLKGTIFSYKGEMVSKEDLDEIEDVDLSLVSFKNGEFVFSNNDLKIMHIGNFYVNGEITGPILESDILSKVLVNEDVVLNEDYYLFLGDNSDSSTDGRYIGFISLSKIYGKLLFRIWPFNRFGRIY